VAVAVALLSSPTPPSLLLLLLPRKATRAATPASASVPHLRRLVLFVWFLVVKGDKDTEQMFPHLKPSDMNQYLNGLQEGGLTAKVFRTYNASFLQVRQCNIYISIKAVTT
jgi:hypothetical protein